MHIDRFATLLDISGDNDHYRHSDALFQTCHAKKGAIVAALKLREHAQRTQQGRQVAKIIVDLYCITVVH